MFHFHHVRVIIHANGIVLLIGDIHSLNFENVRNQRNADFVSVAEKLNTPSKCQLILQLTDNPIYVKRKVL